MRKNNILFFCLIYLGFSQLCFSAEWKRAYMASYQRSGNHWIRYLIEEASRIATGAVYQDEEPPHMDKIFPWGGYCCDHGLEGNCRYPNKDDLVLIKTHYPAQDGIASKFDRRGYEVALRIVRHPVDSFYSRYLRRYGGYNKEKVPTRIVREFIEKWREFQTYWNGQDHVLTVRYEDVLENPFVELKKILDALNYTVSDEDIARAIAKHPPEGAPLKHMSKYSEADLKLISVELADLFSQFNYSIPMK